MKTFIEWDQINILQDMPKLEGYLRASGFDVKGLIDLTIIEDTGVFFEQNEHCWN